MKQRWIPVLVFLASLALLCTAALAVDAPTLSVAADGTVRCEQTGGEALYIADYDAASGQFRGVLRPGAKLGSGNVELKAFQTDAAYKPVSESAGVLVIDRAGSYRGGSYDAVVITAGVGSGAVDLREMDIRGDLCVYAPCDLTLDGTSVVGELRSAVAPSASLMEEGMSSIRVVNASGVGSIRIERTADGGIRIRTEEGCDVEWVLIEDGQGEILLEGDYNQVVVEADSEAPVILDGARVSGLTINGEDADVTLQGGTSVVAVQINEGADGAELTVETGSDVVYLQAETGDVTISGNGTILYADVPTGTAVQPTIPEQPGAHQHSWVIGCVAPGADGQNGTVTFVCTVCGATTADETVGKPIVVEIWLNETGTETRSKRFGSLQEAIDFAERNGDDSEHAVITVAEGANVSLRDSVWLSDAGISLVNGGTIELYSQLTLENASMVNNGTVHIHAYRDGDSEREEENHRFGQLQLWGPDAVLENNGTIRLESIHFTNSEGREDGRYAELTVSNRATLNNSAGALIESGGFLFVRSGTVNNAGTLRNTESMNVELCDEAWASYDGEPPVLEQQSGEGLLRNTGALLNEGWLGFRGTTLESSGSLVNNRQIDMNTGEVVKTVIYLEKREGEPQTDEDWENFRGGADETHWWRRVGEDRQALKVQPSGFYLTGGKLVNGGVTGVGDDFNGSWAEFRLSAGDDGTCEAVNRGELVNNGYMEFENVRYTQDAGAKLTTYNSSELQFRGGAMLVPSGAWFKNEGHMRIIDRYGETLQACDLDGFEDFFTTWNRDGNDSNWCEFTAEVYDFDGYQRAVNVQRERRAVNENTCYDRLDFCGDVTFTEDTVFEDFRDYWIQTRGEQRWHIWDDEREEWVDLDQRQDGAEDYWLQVGSTLTVPKGVKLTIARQNALRIDGAEEQMAWFSPNRLVVKGTLFTEAEQEGSEENGWDWQEEGFVEVWSFGSLDASEGAVINNGRIEVRYYDMGHGETDENGAFRYVHEGIFGRPEECYVRGLNDAVYAAEVRSTAGFVNATANTEPAFYRMYIRDDTCVTLTGDVSCGLGINIEPGSGLIVEYGATLTESGHVWNDGDVSVYGDLVLARNGSFDSNQSLEVGALTGNQKAHIYVDGDFQLRDRSVFKLYPTGSVVLRNGGELQNDLWNFDTDEPERIAVTLDGNPRSVRGAVLPGLELWSEASFERCVFEGAVTLRATPTSNYGFGGCVFNEDVTLEAGNGEHVLMVNFGGDAVFAAGKRVLVKRDGNANVDGWQHNVDLGGVNGLDVVVADQIPIWINPGWIREDARYTVNGVNVEHRRRNDSEVGGGVSLHYELCDDGSVRRIFQVDSTDETEIALTGTLGDFDELRIMQGWVDISGLDTGDAEISISDMWQYTQVNIGSHAVSLGEHCDPNDPENPHGHGFGVVADAGAELVVRYGVALWNEEDDWYGYSTGVNVTVGEEEMGFNPHIFGTRDDRTPAVYIGGKLDNVRFRLFCDGQELPFAAEYLQDEWNGELHWKTHLNRAESGPWFEANQNYDPRLVMTMDLPGGVTVTFDPVPVKPEWREP